jgi:hypothetical protein
MTDKPAKASKSKKSAGVLASLPSTRHERLGRREAAKPTATTAAEPEPTGARSTAGSRAATAEKAQRRASRPSPPRPPEPPREPSRPAAPPKGPELVTTALQAAGEIAQIGITVGGQVLKRAAKRLPRP